MYQEDKLFSSTSGVATRNALMALLLFYKHLHPGTRNNDRLHEIEQYGAGNEMASWYKVCVENLVINATRYVTV